MKRLYLLLCLVLLAISLRGQESGFTIDTLYFGFDSAVLTEDARQQLDSLVGVFSAYPAYYIEIFGHTDSIGSDRYNLDLSEERARIVSLYLGEQGVPLARITYEGLGTLKPVAHNRTYSSRTKNRRVDIAVIYTNESLVPEFDEAAPPRKPVIVGPPPPPPTDTIYCNYHPFPISASKKTVVITPRGTRITIPEEAFITDATELTMEVDEIFERSQYIKANMPTLSKEGQLETAGIMAFAIREERKVPKIQPEAKFDIELPATRRDPEMRIYIGSGGTRGGRRRGRGRSAGPAIGEGDPLVTSAKSWNEERETEVKFRGKSVEKYYVFSVNKPARYTVARPLWLSEDTDKDDKGIDIQLKLKGKRFPKTTTVLATGEVVQTYIPFRKVSDRIYESRKVKFVDPKTPMVVVAIQYSDDGQAYLVKRYFTTQEYLKKKKPKKGSRDRQKIKLKAKFRKVTKERLNELIKELDV